MRLVDSHSHLNHRDFNRDREAVLARAAEAGVVCVLVVGYDLPSSKTAAQIITTAHGGSCDLYAAVGIHPHDAVTVDDAALARLRELLARPEVVGVGETGLDYYRDLSPRDVQQRALRAHLALAREVGKPVILHNRDADEDMLRILREEGLPDAGGVLHCFSGDEHLAAEALALGLVVSAAGQITYKNADALRRAVATVPLGRLMVETDCPYLTPMPFRGKRNEPARVVETARCIAALHGVPVEDVAEATTKVFEGLFCVRV